MNWWQQGSPCDLKVANGINTYSGRDKLHQFWFPLRDAGCPEPTGNGAPIMVYEKDYTALKPYLHTDQLLDTICQNVNSFSEAKIMPTGLHLVAFSGFLVRCSVLRTISMPFMITLN